MSCNEDKDTADRHSEALIPEEITSGHTDLYVCARYRPLRFRLLGGCFK